MENYLSENLRKFKQIMKEINSSLTPLADEISKKIYFLDIFFFSKFPIDKLIDLKYIQAVSDALELTSIFSIKKSHSYLTYNIPATNIVMEDLSLNYYLYYNDEEPYFFRFYSNNTIDINHNVYINQNKFSSKYSIRDCLILLINITTTLKHLFYLNKYLDINTRIRWKYNKPTDSSLFDLENLHQTKNDFLNIIVLTSDLINVNRNFTTISYANSINSFKFLFHINHKNRKQFINEYIRQLPSSRNKIFKQIFNAKFNNERDRFKENKLNSFLFISAMIAGIEITYRVVIVSKSEKDVIYYNLVNHGYNYYLSITNKFNNTIYIDSTEGNVLKDKKIIFNLSRNLSKRT